MLDIAHAHVKWFVPANEIVARETMHFSISDPFVAGSVIMIAVGIIVAFILDRYVPKPPAAFNRYAKKLQPKFVRIFAVVLGLNLILEAYLGAMIAPPFKVFNNFTGFLQVIQVLVGLFLLGGLYVREAVVVLLVLYFTVMTQFGVIPLLDEINIIGLCGFLLLSLSRRKKDHTYAVAILRIFTGLALMILAFSEKILHPELGLEFLKGREWNVMNLMGFEGFTDYMFVFAAGSVELLLGTIFVLGLITRINAAVAALFFTTTLILLGPIEVIGHLPIFATMAVLLLYGSGKKLILADMFRFK